MFELIGVKYNGILDLPSLEIDAGTITALVGPSGGGKTTLLRLLNKMISPTQGKILYKGADLSQINSVDHRRRVVMLSQSPVMFPGSIRDNLTIGFKFQGKEIPDDDILSLGLNDIKLNKPLDELIDTLSGGEKQRLAIARVLLLNPEVYLLDEPSSALDETTAQQMIGMVSQHVRKHMQTLVLVTHSLAIANQFSDRIIELAAGTLCK